MRNDSTGPPHPATVLLLTLGAGITGVLAGTLLILMWQYHDPALLSPGLETTVTSRQNLRCALFLNTLFTFVLPAIAVLAYSYRSRIAAYLGTDHIGRSSDNLAGLLLFLAALPAISFANWLNQQVPLPGWLAGAEDGANASLRAVLTIETPSEFALSFLVIALLAALGEELIFRGILQRQLDRLFGTGHLSIWLAAFIFSAIHFQFAGFLPRLLLGAALGYAYRWSGSLFTPIALHAAFNGVQVIAVTFLPDQEFDPLVKEMPDPSWAALSLVAVVLIIWLRRPTEAREN
ncbi:MAG: CPBP family intramembrane glutamic endopeptidase [Saprospiraceae bacterium]